MLCDRFADSTVVYQGYGRGLDTKTLKQLNEVAVDGLWPDLTIVLDIDPEIGLKRATLRNLEKGMAKEEGRFEAEHLNFHKRIREGYLTWAALHRDRIRVVNAAASPDEVFSRIRITSYNVCYTKLLRIGRANPGASSGATHPPAARTVWLP